MTPDKFKELLERARKLAGSNEASKSAFEKTSNLLAAEKPHTIDLTAAGIPETSLTSPEGEEAAVEVIQELITPAPEQSHSMRQKTGVAAEVELNSKQQLFLDTMLSGEDCCLIGAAGTGKTTCTGKSIRALIDSGILRNLGTSTKVLNAFTPGVLITSFTRKAVNNIKRAVDPVLKPHVLTLHKVLEFQPEFSEIVDPNDPTKIRKTMTFIPARNRLNPLPSGLTHVFFEESSMIGTDLYNLFCDACPHNPQEIFIGDIRQLPPIFGPAILGFKMALLPIVELTEVYRQAMKSPIIRLAHSILSGDSTLFRPEVKVREEYHPHLLEEDGAPKIMRRKYVPSLEVFNEDSDHGMVKIQIWQKTLPDDVACNTTIQQFIAWEQSGYYNPEDDLLLCPFNKAFGTIELNKGIHQYLGTKRGATVHEVIAGFQTHYLAVGDRVLYDKEDATIIDINRNPVYLGKSPRPASVNLDRWGAYQKSLDEQELTKAATETELSAEALDNFLENAFRGDSEDRVNAASHEITIRFAYTDEVVKLSSSSEVNALLGGHAITVHKAQGSENHTIFLVLHKTHAIMVQNELLYTAVTRARQKLHIICETDTFFKGVKSQKVRGHSLEDKIKFFQGKVEFGKMQEELEFLQKQKAAKRELLQQRKQEFDRKAKTEAVVAVFQPQQLETDVGTEWRKANEDLDSILSLNTDYDNREYPGLPASYTKVTQQQQQQQLQAQSAPPTVDTSRLALLEKLRSMTKAK